jgi:hypothetical protein
MNTSCQKRSLKTLKSECIFSNLEVDRSNLSVEQLVGITRVCLSLQFDETISTSSKLAAKKPISASKNVSPEPNGKSEVKRISLLLIYFYRNLVV